MDLWHNVQSKGVPLIMAVGKTIKPVYNIHSIEYNLVRNGGHLRSSFLNSNTKLLENLHFGTFILNFHALQLESQFDFQNWFLQLLEFLSFCCGIFV